MCPSHVSLDALWGFLLFGSQSRHVLVSINNSGHTSLVRPHCLWAGLIPYCISWFETLPSPSAWLRPLCSSLLVPRQAILKEASQLLHSSQRVGHCHLFGHQPAHSRVQTCPCYTALYPTSNNALIPEQMSSEE